MAPERLWAPWMGHSFGLRPADLGDLTPEQLFDCLVFVERSNKPKKGR